jgi:3-oxoacyl-[acyl-carrier protein] reductase
MSYSPIETMPVEMWDEMMAVNVRSAFLCSRLVIPNMKAERWGRIINLGSQLAQKGAPDLAHYGASKAAVIGFTRSLARELIGFGITVNAICPGPIDTDLSRTNRPEWKAELIRQIPIRRYGEPEEIAPTAVLLASEGGSFYVGAALHPNGGDLMA